ncbi:hypothetical protein ACVJMZ_006479 [Sinorhizobium medicae]|nr:hypothetical protein [Sinorhizobium medicae]
MPKMVFVNLPVRDLAVATRFYEAIGCEKNQQFSDQNAASMVGRTPSPSNCWTHDFSRPSRRSRDRRCA